MISFIYPWIFLALPLPWLVHRLASPATTQEAALYFPRALAPESRSSQAGATARRDRSRLALLLLAWLGLLCAAAGPNWTGEPVSVPVSGRDLITGLPQTAEITSTKVYEALQAPCRQILQGIRSVLDKAPPELAADVLRKGVFLMGGASQLHGLDHFLAAELGLPVTVAKEPMLCAALGVGRLVDDPSNLPFVARLSATQDESE